MSDALDRALQKLRREYLASLPARLDELRSDLAGVRDGRPEAAAALQTRLHQLAGSGGSYGFSELSKAAREAEHWIATHPIPVEAPGLDVLLNRLIDAAGEAAGQPDSGAAGQ
jgi:HPt (histidine-containing phosphotransfer) domain-containing protein